jgi:hypothetical protein
MAMMKGDFGWLARRWVSEYLSRPAQMTLRSCKVQHRYECVGQRNVFKNINAMVTCARRERPEADGADLGNKWLVFA